RDAYVLIESQQERCGAPDSCQGRDGGSHEAEVVAPVLSRGMIKRGERARSRIKRGDVAALGTIALEAGIGQGLARCRATMLERDDVVGLVGVHRLRFRHEAVLAAPSTDRSRTACRNASEISSLMNSGSWHRRLDEAPVSG